MAIIVLTGVFEENKDDWGAITEPGQSITNWERLVLAHPELNGYHSKSYNVKLDQEYVPPDDNDHRTAAFEAWQNGSQLVSEGQDLLRRSNYVHPAITIVSIDDGTTVYTPPAGVVYYAGDSDSFDEETPDPITRDYLEIMSTDDIAAEMGHSGGEEVTVTIDDGQP